VKITLNRDVLVQIKNKKQKITKIEKGQFLGIINEKKNDVIIYSPP